MTSSDEARAGLTNASRWFGARPARRLVLLVVLVAAFAVAIGVWRSHGGTGTAAAPTGLKATRGDLTLIVGGVGQIVQAGQSTQPATTAGGAPAAETPGFPVFPLASGQVTTFLVAPGQHVVAGQPVALLNDGGLAAAGIGQAQVDVASARLEWRQKRANDPLKGTPPTSAEFVAGHVAVTSARARLARLLLPPRASDVSMLDSTSSAHRRISR